MQVIRLVIFVSVSALIVSCAGEVDGDDQKPSTKRPGKTGALGPSGSGLPGAMGEPGAGPAAPGTGGAGSPGAIPGSPANKPPGTEIAPMGPLPSSTVAGTRLARLSHKQWEATARELLRLPAAPGLSASFNGDHAQGRFDNAGSLLQVTAGLRLDYQQSAELLAERVTADAAALARLMPMGLPTDVAGRTRGFIEAFGRRAYRRPLTTAEIGKYVALFPKGAVAYAGKDPFVDGVRLTIEAMMQSPHFLYRTEMMPASMAGRAPLSPWEVAAKLSFTLVNAMPDDALFVAAAANDLILPDKVRAQAERLLNRAEAADLYDDFHAQLLRLHTYEQIDKDPKLFPEFVAGLNADLRTEALRFTRSVVEKKGGLSDLLLSPATFVNKRLAAVYRLDGTFSTATFTPVNLDPATRAGILTQAGFLASNAHRAEVDSIHRGVFIHNNLLCTNLPPPAPGVALTKTAGKTNRERVVANTGPGTCGAGCHSTIINPVGFAFESFDALGRYRTQDNGVNVDSSGEYIFGGETKSWKTPVEFARHMAASPEAHSCYARNWLEYLFGRAPEAGDDALLKFMGERSRIANVSVRAILLDLVTSDSFLTRAP